MKCPNCGEDYYYVHHSESWDEGFCTGCSYEERTKLAEPRPLKPIEVEPEPSAWRRDISHPAHKGHMKKNNKDWTKMKNKEQLSQYGSRRGA